MPEDPIFQLVFPQAEMLSVQDFGDVRNALVSPDSTRVGVRSVAERIRASLNPQPAGQRQDNVPIFNGQRMEGMQHKYRNTVLFFPMEVGEISIESIAVCSYDLRGNTATPTARTAFVGRSSLQWDQTSK